jgi:hypothetical protein
MRMSDVGFASRQKASPVSGHGTWMTEWVDYWGKRGFLFIGTGISRVLLAVAALGFFCVAAHATEKEAQCPPEWAHYVERAGAVRENLGTDVVLLFESRDGDVFDCLGLVDDPPLIDLATLITRGMPFDRETPLGDDPSLWPTNVCSNGWSHIPGLDYHFISLPRDVGILDGEYCRALFTNFENFLMKGYERG